MTGPTVAVPQLTVADLRPERNVASVRERTAALDDAVCVALFPEYALTGFVADERLGDAALTRAEAVEYLTPIADENDIDVLAGYVERDGAALYNAAAYVRPDGSHRIYRKRHLWGGEEAMLDTGTECVVVDTPAGKTGLLTCYDLNFVAESAQMTERRVDALFVIGAWPAAHSENWRLLCRARALDGVRWVVGAGRTGQRDVAGTRTTQYAGRSLVVRPDGAVAAALGRDERDLVYTLDRSILEEQRAFVGAVD
ncbi:carbon-nitrogen hydrolase family protein [Halogeometricum borinquense]|uniref:Carbon-nitrogen hydrolase family protein n=1 Tax=Halogeometricum borinquense TaxID=60847 RepID=A0A6C0UE24_9EURY|nr:carbon-nitrogen hydrolase family protein [Halogeometricum borinquense]QIB73656.1 carbon-nitrogen hydrolase family protein [Halogeometricum borinquense]QIQ76988.1 carbon-nitrogen hydrolase family protein [Halogeometricum borinquense]